MKTQEMCATLRAFAGLAEASRAEELRKFASIFNVGKDETVAERVKRVLARWKANSERSYPTSLRRTLASIQAGFSASGARKQETDMKAILSLFVGAETASMDSFVERINAALVAPQVATPRRKKPEAAPDQKLARELSDELTRTVLDLNAFSKVIDRLEDKKLVSTPTLAVVGNRFLGNSKAYDGRSPVIKDILKRQKLDARDSARGKPLDRIGV